MVSELTTAWVTLAADNSNLALAKSTMESAASSLRIVKRQQQVGVAAATDVSEAMAVYQQARASVASYQTQVMQDKNALNLLAGDTVPDTLLPGTLESLSDNAITLIPAGVSSSALLRRPDIKEAEHNLLSANANIGAARANFFPTISLTASAGVGSDSLSSLFSHGMKVWSFAPSITLPLFSGGNNLAQLRYAEAEKKGLIATYEKTIQSAFKDVADALARRETLSEQLDAQREYVAAEQKTLDVATRSYQAGAGDYLTVLTAQRSLWSAQESLISLQQTDLENRITLWQSLGVGLSNACGAIRICGEEKIHTFGWRRYTECNDIFLGKHVSLNGGFDEICTPGLSAGLPAVRRVCPCSGKGRPGAGGSNQAAGTQRCEKSLHAPEKTER